MKILFLCILMFALTTHASEWNQVTCFMKKKRDQPIELEYTQFYNQNFSLEVGESKALSIIWSKKRDNAQTGFCTKLFGFGQKNQAYITTRYYRADTIKFINQNCEVKGENAIETSVDKKIINRGEYIINKIPWEREGFDSIFALEYLPLESEISGDMETFANEKCREILDRLNK